MRTTHLGVILLGIYIVALTILCVLALVQVSTTDASLGLTGTETSEPTDTATGETLTETGVAQSSGQSGSLAAFVPFPVFGLTITSAEMQLTLMVALSGALGGLVHDMRSYRWYVGNRQFVGSWIPFYVIQPFAGAALAILFYYVIRGGFFSPTAGSGEVNSFGFIALGGLIGLFSEQAILKLKAVSETVFVKPEPGKDHFEEETEETNEEQES
jgi:hypothetical protein